MPAIARPAETRRLQVKPVRRWFGLTQGAFARALGVSRATVARWEAQHTGPEPNSAEGRLLTALVEARDLAVKMFGPSQGRGWFRSSIPVFHGKHPVEVLTERGPIPVRDELRIAWEGGY